MRGRPNLYTSYESESSMVPTGTQKVAIAALLVVLVLMPFDLPIINQIPGVRFLGDNSWLRPMIHVFIFAVAALGLNILTGLTGQVSLGHSFFMGAGACTAVLMGGTGGETLWGWGLPMWIWLPAAGLVAAAIGIVVSPIAVRLRGLYLGIVTLGLVFIGLHLSRLFPKIAGPAERGRRWPTLDLRIWKEDDPLLNLSDDGRWLWFDVSDNQKMYFFALMLVIVGAIAAKNIARSRTGRAMVAIRERDVAAEVMGVPEAKYKLMAFALSAFYAGVAGAVFASFIGQINPEFWDLTLAVEFIAILLIGGTGTVSGTLMGTFFVIMTPNFVEELTDWLAEQAGTGGITGSIADLIITEGPGDSGAISVATQAQGWALNVFDWNLVLYGVLIVVFLVFEPLGLYGIWTNVKRYWKGWPFSY